MRNAFLKKFYILPLVLVISVFNLPRVSADDEDTSTGQIIDMVSGDIQSVPVNNLTRVSVTNPEIADISNADADKVSLIAKKAGSTVLFLWDADGKHNIKIRVAAEDLTSLKERVEKILQEANIKGVSMEENLDIGKVVLSGDMSKEEKNRMGDILEPYSDNLMNLVKEQKNEELIQVDMQIVEINISLEKDLGILWGNTSGGSNSSSSSGTSGGSNGQAVFNYVEQPPGGNKFNDLFKIGNFSRNTALAATVNAWIQEGKARLISKPRLVAVSGKQASFLVGGEIPIESTTASTTGTTLTQNTTYAQYGVNLSVTPTIKDGKIDVLLNVDIRDVDSATPISSSGGQVAFVTRTASTDLLMDNKQTIALAGLIKYEDSVQVNRVPFLSSIPIVGALFRNRAQPGDSNTEMVIILTPTVLTEKKFADKQIVMPTPDERNSWKEIDSKYEHEPLPAWPAAAPSKPIHVDTPSPEAYPVMVAYARMVQEKISKAISYPPAAMVSGGGTVKLKLHILKDGSLDSEEVMESSGSTILDQDAMQAAKSAAPYAAFTTGIDQSDMVFTIPIVYNRMVSGGRAPADKVIATY